MPAHLVNSRYLYIRVPTRNRILTESAASPACAHGHRVHAPWVGRDRRRRVAASATTRSLVYETTLSSASRSDGFQNH